MNVFFALERYTQVHRQVTRQALRPVGLGVAEFVALAWLNREAVLKCAELSRACGESRQRMHQLLVGLSERGLVVRICAEWDPARAVGWRLTEQGRSTYALAERELTAMDEALQYALGSSAEAVLRLLRACGTTLATRAWGVVDEGDARWAVEGGPVAPPRPGAVADWDP